MFPLRENRCHRFQANIFNKSKCQNCFKPLDSHILIDIESYPRKTVQAGWLLLAPEDTDFRHKNRKWQRRYFVLYKHGFLFYSLDAMPSTLPHGSVNMTQCREILDASAQTGFQNCLKLCFTDRDYYIRTDNADALSISRWQSNLQVYPKASKLNQKLKDSVTGQQTAQQKTENQTSKSGIKKSLSSGSISGSISNSSINRRGSLTSSHYPDGKGPVSSSDQLRNTVTNASGIVEASTVSAGRSCSAVGIVKKDSVGTVEGVPGFSPTDLEESTHNGGTGGPSRSGSDQSITSTLASSLSSSFEQLQEMSITHGTRNRLGNESGYSSLEKTSSPSGDSQNIRSQSDSLPARLTQEAKLSSAVTPSSNASREPLCRDEVRDLSKPSKLSSLRSKSLERRQTDPAPTPDLLNFKKGWMSKLGDNGKWQKHWFVLTDKTLRFYRDAVAEEAADVDGEINLSTCFDVTDYPVQRNYGFQIHTKEGVFTLCAMTYGIRRNWVQAIMKNIRPTVAPDVTWKRSIKSSFIPQRIPTSGQQARPCSSQYSTLPKNEDPRSRLRDRRKEGRYKTFDWADLKRQKEELSNDMSGRDWNKKCERSVPPAPASSPEGMTKNSISQPTYKDFAQQLRSVDVPSLLVVSRRTSQESISPDSLEVDTGTIQVHIKRPSDEDKMIDQSTSPVPVSLSSSSAQTELQWQEELQSLCEELKAQREKNQSQEKEFKLTESRLQAGLNNTQDCLQRAESRIQDAEILLKKREEELESLRGHFQEATGRLKTMEETQALKEVRLQNHLRLLQESQERERRSLTDSLDQSEHRLKELEVCLMEKKAELQKRPVDESADDLIRRCQELQNQLEESDGEVTRLQARLQTEETLYYDMEHDYEQACEEIQSLRGNLLNSDRVCEERFQSQLVQQQQEMDKKERELQEVLVKMSILGSSLEEAELKLKEKEDLYNNLIESQHVNKATNIQQLDLERQEDAFRMISVIQALEHKLCDTEDRLRDLTVHLKQQQKLNPGLCALNGDFDFCFHENGVSGDQWLNGETPGCHALHLARRVLSLEALVVQKMASALEHPSGKLLKRISEMHEEVLMMTRERSCTRLVRSNLAQSLLNPLEQDPIDLLSERTIHNMCVRADMAFLVHTQPSPELPSHLLSTRTEHGSKQGTNFADMNPPELVPYSEQTEDTSNLFLHDCENLFRNSLVAELRAQARSLQDFSSQLRFDSRGEEFSSKLPNAFLRLVMGRATLAYMICRVRATMRQEMTSLCKQREQAECECRAMCRSMESLFQEQTERFEEKLREERVSVEKVEMRRASAENEARLKSEEVEKLQVEFEDKLQELQKIHEDEMGHLHEYYMQNTPKLSVQKPTELESEETKRSVAELQDRNRKLELEITCLKEELSSQNVEAFQLDLENIKATYEHGFSIIEDSNQRVIEDLQRQHQREVERLTEEKERVLQEETNATIAAIEAMRKAHKEEMDKTQKAQENGVIVDISEQLNQELETLNRELEVLSEQYSQKCLENMQLARTVESEKEALSSTQRENQELRSHNQELNECLATELSMMYSRMNGELQHSQSSQEKDVFQLEVNLRVKESEIKCLKQEINTVKLELQATNSHFKDLESELSSLGVKIDLSRKRKVPVRQQSLNYDLFKYRSNPDFQKDNAARPQPVRSKSLKDELSVLERMTLFELPGSQKH